MITESTNILYNNITNDLICPAIFNITWANHFRLLYRFVILFIIWLMLPFVLFNIVLCYVNNLIILGAKSLRVLILAEQAFLVGCFACAPDSFELAYWSTWHRS